MPKQTTLARLPARLRKKISLATEGDEMSCWLWQGCKAGPTIRARNAWKPPTFTGYRSDTLYLKRTRPEPKVHSTEVGYTIPAHRLIYAVAHRLPVKDVPRLRRCVCDICVSPHHVSVAAKPKKLPDQLKASDRRPEPSLTIVGASGNLTPVATHAGPRLSRDSILAALRKADVPPFYDLPEAAEEAGLPAGTLPLDVWQEYQRSVDPDY